MDIIDKIKTLNSVLHFERNYDASVTVREYCGFISVMRHHHNGQSQRLAYIGVCSDPIETLKENLLSRLH